MNEDKKIEIEKLIIKEVRDFLSQEILFTLLENVPQENYILDKIEELKENDRRESWKYCIKLDSKNLNTLAERLGTTAQEIKITSSHICRF